METKPFYRYCLVPKCKNTNRNAPDKVYFHIPRNASVRKKWCRAMKRADEVSSTSCLYCCEDHFNIEIDTENYIQYKIMTLQEGQKVTLRLKKGVIPHIFTCQKAYKLEHPESKGAFRRKNQILIEDEEPPSKSTLKQTVKHCIKQEIQDKIETVSVNKDDMVNVEIKQELLEIEDFIISNPVINGIKIDDTKVKTVIKQEMEKSVNEFQIKEEPSNEMD